LVAFASSLDQIGPLTKTVEDCALLMEIISGHDRHDSTSCPVKAAGYSAKLDRPLKGKKVGLPTEYFGEGLAKEVKYKVLSAVNSLGDEGVEIVDISLPHTDKSIATYYVLCTAEASSNLARYDGVRYGLRKSGKDLIDSYILTRTHGFGAEVRRRILLGTYVLSAGYYDAYYRRAVKVRTRIREDFVKAFHDVDCIVTPTCPTPAFRLGEKIDDPLSMYLSDIYTVSAPLAGLPAISVPCGESSSGLPIGVQLIGKAFDERTILNFAYALEKKRAAS
jgi:aspartyl-tRNA(Asn)/glutamyl-tRNA(Gln) amidotransferase subunit A